MVNECELRERAALTGLYISTGALLVLLLACSSRACQVAAAAAPRQGETRPQAVRRTAHYGSGLHALFHGHCRVGMHATVWCFVGGWRWFSVHENNRYGGSSTAVKAVCGAHMTRRYDGYLGSRSGAVRRRRLLKRGRKAEASDKAAARVRDYPQAQGAGAPRNGCVPRQAESAARQRRRTCRVLLSAYQSHVMLLMYRACV